MAAAPLIVPKLLVVEDDPATAMLIAKMLSAVGVESQHASSCREAYRVLISESFSCLVIDLGLPDGSGCDIQQTLAKRGDVPPVVFMSSEVNSKQAVEIKQRNDSRFVPKRAAFLELLREAVLSIVALESDGVMMSAVTESAARPIEDVLVGGSPPMRELRNKIERCANSERTVLVSGQTGTGKELVARAIHDAGPRAQEPFVAVNCAAIAGTLFESELFGSVRGAFTGAVRDHAGLIGAAGQGTLFLDEIGELPLDAQAKLLRVLEQKCYRQVGSSQEKHSDARVIAATNRDLCVEVAEGNFRRDLFYRLDIMNIAVPPLRERLADLPMLVEAFLKDEAESSSSRCRSVSSAGLAQLQIHSWPGNVRELRHAVLRTLAWCDDPELQAFDLAHANVPADAAVKRAGNRRELAWSDVAGALRENAGRLGPTAASLQVSVRTLQRRLRDLGMSARDFR
ncbi:MAG: two-component system response regulator PilR (NtrC family) [Myxococcota bacterium]